MGYDPNDAPKPAPRRFKNVLRYTVNEVVTVQEAHDKFGRYREIPESMDPEEPYWVLQAEAVDAKFEDGGKLQVDSSTALFSHLPDGSVKMKDSNQRPSRIVKAFRGLGVNVFPGAPAEKFAEWQKKNGIPVEQGIVPNEAYDAARVVGNVFLVEMEEQKFNDRTYRYPLPIQEMGTSYVHTGQVRLIPRRETANEDGTVGPSAAQFTDILKDTEAQAKVLAAVSGRGSTTDSADDLYSALREAGIGNGVTIDGESILAVVIGGELPAKLEKAGLATLVEDRIVVGVNGAKA